MSMTEPGADQWHREVANFTPFPAIIEFTHQDILLCFLLMYTCKFSFESGSRKRVRVQFCFSFVAVVVQSRSCFRLFATLWTVAHQAPLSMGVSRQEYWTGLPCLPPGDLPDPGIEPKSLKSPALAGRFFTTSATWEAHSAWIGGQNLLAFGRETWISEIINNNM